MAANKRRANPATQAVQIAQGRYPKVLEAVTAYFGPIPYGVEVVDPRTADRRLSTMTPEQLQQMATTDPNAAEQAARRIAQLDVKAAALPPLPGGDDFEP